MLSLSACCVQVRPPRPEVEDDELIAIQLVLAADILSLELIRILADISPERRGILERHDRHPVLGESHLEAAFPEEVSQEVLGQRLANRERVFTDSCRGIAEAQEMLAPARAESTELRTSRFRLNLFDDSLLGRVLDLGFRGPLPPGRARRSQTGQAHRRVSEPVATGSDGLILNEAPPD